jgi:hypothetical protein
VYSVDMPNVHRPVIKPEIAAEVERRRGLVPFQAYINELLRQAMLAEKANRTSLSETWRR